jgi:hypothetical protein
MDRSVKPNEPRDRNARPRGIRKNWVQCVTPVQKEKARNGLADTVRTSTGSVCSVRLGLIALPMLTE